MAKVLRYKRRYIGRRPFAEWAADCKVDLTLISDKNEEKHIGDYELELVDND